MVVVFAERRIGELSRELPKASPPGKKVPKVGSISGKAAALANYGIKQQDASRYEAEEVAFSFVHKLSTRPGR